jgi:EEF1A lysine methyltransferase 4
LIVGCGTSRLTEELVKDGYPNVQSIDISYSAIKLMQDTHKESNLVFKQMDVRNLQYKDGSFDCVIDKALLDALVCGEGPKATAT